MFLCFIPIWGRFPFWLIFFRWVEPPTSCQLIFFSDIWSINSMRVPCLWSIFDPSKNTGGEGNIQILCGASCHPDVSVACYLLLKRGQIRLKFRSLKNWPSWFQYELRCQFPQAEIPNPVLRLTYATYVDLEKLNRHESTSFFPEKLLSKISNCVQLGNDLRFGIPFVAGKRNDFSMETLEEKGFLWLPFVWIWCQSKLGVSNSFFSLGTTPLWLRILFVLF